MAADKEKKIYNKKGLYYFSEKYVLRSKGNSILLLIVSMVFLLALGWILQSVKQTENNVEMLYENINVEVEILQKNLVTLISPEYIADKSIADVLDTGFVKESRLIAQKEGEFLYGADGKNRYTAFTLCGITAADFLNQNNQSGKANIDASGEIISEGQITYLTGWDDTMFSKEYDTEIEEYPIVVPESILEYFDVKTGDSLILQNVSSKYEVIIAGSYTGKFTNFEVIKGSAVLMPLSLLRKLSSSMLYYSNAEFVLDPMKNRNLSEFREITEKIEENDSISKSEISFRIWDEELRMTAEPMEKNLTLMKVLYPIAQIVAMLAGGMVSMLLLLQSAKRAAILRVLGIPAKTVRKMLGAEQLTLGVIGTVLGILLCVILGKWNIELLFSIGLYLFGLVIGTVIGCILVTNKKPLELLQVKE